MNRPRHASLHLIMLFDAVCDLGCSDVFVCPGSVHPTIMYLLVNKECVLFLGANTAVRERPALKF